MKRSGSGFLFCPKPDRFCLKPDRLRNAAGEQQIPQTDTTF